jgi:hypothetical protein
MLFTKRLHPGIRSGEITCTVRIWKRCHVRVGGRYAVAQGYVEVDSIESIDLAEVSGDLARRSGFKGLLDLLKVARHGSGEHIYLITFHYRETRQSRGGAAPARQQPALETPPGRSRGKRQTSRR